MEPTRSSDEELFELLEALSQEQITPQQAERLEQWVCDDVRAREIYLQYMHLCAHLPRFLDDDQQGETLDQVREMLERFASDDGVPPSEKVAAPSRPSPTGLFGPVFGHVSWQYVLSASLLGVLMGGLGFYLGAKASREAAALAVVVAERPDREASSIPLGSIPLGSIPLGAVATLQSTAGATWRGTELPTVPGSRLVPGTLQLHAGVAEIEFDNGAVMVIQGPATLDIQSRDRSFLHRGKLLAHVPTPAIGFTVETPTAIIVDFGTDFGIVAGASGKAGATQTEVHVFEGEVDLAPHSDGVSLAPKRRLVKGEAARLDFQKDEDKTQGSFAWHSMSADRNSFSHLGFMVPLQEPTSDFSQTVGGSLGVQYMLDPDPSTGWAVARNQGSDSTAVVETVTDIGFTQGTTLTFTLEHLRNATHNLGRFRLSVTTDERSTFADGFVNGGDVTATWTVLDPLTFSSSGGATLTEQEDHSLLVSEINPDNDAYTITAETTLTGITGFRLEALADESLPEGGPGRAEPANGNFVVTHFTVMAAPLNPVSFVASLPESAGLPEWADYDPSAQIRFHTPAQADAKRQELIHFMWPDGLPTTAMPTVARGISFPEDLKGVTPSLVSHVDQLHFNIHVAEHQLPSSGYLLSPTTPAAVPRLGIVHQGHQAGVGDGLDLTIDYLLGQGFHVAVMQMPFLGGNSTVVTLPEGSMMTFSSGTGGHSKLFEQFSGRLDGGLFAFFLEPIVQTINHFVEQNPKVQDIMMIGLSGGGWTTHMAAAIDARIDLSIAVAGALPLYARPFSPGSAGDAEQEYGPLFHEIDAVPDANNIPDTADGVASWLEIFALGGYGPGRRQIQVLNYHDSCCFSGDVHKTYDDFVSNQVDDLGQGDWDFVSDTSHSQHLISPFTINNVLAPAIAVP